MGKKDPIDRLRKYLMEKRSWTEDEEKKLIEELSAEVEQAVKEYESVDAPSPSGIFNHIYSDMPWHLKEQLSELEAYVQEGGKR